jgi:DNA polymerase
MLPTLPNFSKRNWRLYAVQAASRTKNNRVGEGNPNADLMLIGEAPGADEDIQGRPFVGRAGQLLMQMIKAIDFERKDVFIANILKCRPPNNRPPEPDEIHECTPFLWKQISIIQPKLILALGTFAAQTLLQSKSSISSLRNRVYDMPFGKVLATYHPSFLLRSPQKSRKRGKI